MRALRLAAAAAALAALTLAAAAPPPRRAASPPLRSGQQPAPSLFGINTGTYDTSEARLARDLPTAVALGARWVHFTGDSIKYGATAAELRADGRARSTAPAASASAS